MPLYRTKPFDYETADFGVWECIREFRKDEFAVEAWERQTLGGFKVEMRPNLVHPERQFFVFWGLTWLPDTAERMQPDYKHVFAGWETK